MEFIGIDPVAGSPVEVVIKGDRVESLRSVAGKGESLPYICRGFLDMQVNGYRGDDYSQEGLKVANVLGIIDSLAASGTSRHVATIVTNSRERIIRNLRVIAEAARSSRLAAEALVGCHVEGPFISSEDGPRGAHDARYVRDPSFDEFLEWQDASSGLVKIVTVAPERAGALEFIERAAKTGVAVAVGHTAASPELIREAVAAGARLSTHLGNGSHASLPRLRNYIWEQLAADELTAGIISDGFHLPGSVVKTFERAKGLDRLVLVSDAAPPGGSLPGRYRWGDLDVEVLEDGSLAIPGTKFLAGAGHLLDWDIPAFMRFTGRSLAETLSLCTASPARAIGLDEEDGPSLRPGSRADIALFRFEEGASRLLIERTVVAGETAWPRQGVGEARA